jgi:hypothetical protein
LRPPKKKFKKKKRKKEKEKTKKKGILLEHCKRTVRSHKHLHNWSDEEKQIQEKLCTFWGQALFAPINFSALSKSAFSAWKRIGRKFLEF